ncbi:MAG TPA: hypothetical protein VIH22_19645 [Cyclobacteriaceae bacterium]|jgi:hypothetical protein
MTEAYSTSLVDCEHCYASNEYGRKFCSQCSFPIGGTEEEKTSFRLVVSSRKRFLDDAKDKIKSAKTVIYILAGLFFVFGLVIGFVMDDFATMVANLSLTVIYLVLAAWCTRNPFGAILTAFILYVTLQVVNVLIDPATLIQGFVIKFFVIVALVKGIRSAHEAQGYLRELQNLKAVPVDNE